MTVSATVGSVGVPWIEKYRPKGLQDISSQEETVAVLKKTIESSNLPHLLFYGPPGTGKTSTILALARDLFGPEHFRSRVLELNASDERGIDVIREKVKNFARANVSQGSSTRRMPAFKIIILDEADSMTNDAQAALRRTMETYTKMTRFCLVCNYVSRIIEPLASRCAKFRFKPLDPSSMQSRLRTIASSEQVNCSDDTIETLAELSEGDLRKAIMYMQSASRLCRDEEVTADIFNDIAGVVPADVVDGMFAAWVSKDVKVIQEKVNAMIRNGYSAGQLVNQLHDRVLADVTLSSRQKALMCQSIAKMDKALVDGADEQLQLLSTMLSDF
ncbi:replication factor C subunit 4-like protein [Zopfochytrium polystomum]|nr:replication factor C subunit 4-like protein [Zopfochytrium polystomum]